MQALQKARAGPPAGLHRFAVLARPVVKKLSETRVCQASKTAFRSRCARPGEAFCPNIQPRAHARLTGLTRRACACAAGYSDRTPRSGGAQRERNAVLLA